MSDTEVENDEAEESEFDPDQPWTWSACQTNTCNEDTCDGPEAHLR